MLTDLSSRAIEIEASAPGYRTKTQRFVEPIPFFTFSLEQSRLPLHTPVDELGDDLPPFSGRRHALIVGVSDYQDPGHRYLKAAKEEAEALADFLKSPEGGNYAPDFVMVLTDKKATRASIMGELFRMAERAEKGDLILFLFSGHGRVVGAERFLIPYDGEFSAPAATCIEHEDVKKLLDKHPDTYQMVMLDTCFAGTIKATGRDHPMVGLASSPHRCVLTATKGDETGIDPSPFAKILVDALSGKIPADTDGDGNLMASELHSSICPLVQMEAAKTGERMTPQLYNPEFAAKVNLVRRRR
jgi:hypothetical protein